jgi:hypothetical protein
LGQHTSISIQLHRTLETDEYNAYIECLKRENRSCSANVDRRVKIPGSLNRNIEGTALIPPTGRRHPAVVGVRLFLSFFPHIPCSYTFALAKLILRSLRTRRHRLDGHFFVQAYRGLKSFTALLENVSLRVPTRHVRGFSTFSVCPSNKHCPSARCA